MADDDRTSGFWSSLPGILTGLAALIVAIVAAYAAIWKADVSPVNTNAVDVAPSSTIAPVETLAPVRPAPELTAAPDGRSTARGAAHGRQGPLQSRMLK